MDTGERVDSGWPVPCAARCMMHDTLHDTVALPRPLLCSPLSPLLLRCLWCCPLCARLGTTRVLVGVWCGGVGGGGAASRWLGSPPLEFPLAGADACTPRQGVTLLYGPSICTPSVQMDLRRNQVLRPFPTPGSGTLWVAAESLRDRCISCLPRWTVCPTRSPSQDTNRSTCRGESSWSGPLATPPRPVPPRAADQRSRAYPGLVC